MIARLEVAIRWFFDRSAPLTFFVLFLFGAVMLLASVGAGVGFFELPLPDGTRKQVGYIWALNWSFMFLLGFPIMFFFILETADSLRRTLGRLVENRMILDDGWAPVPQEALDAERARFWQRSAVIGAVMLVAFMTYCIGEWYYVCGRHLFANAAPIAPDAAHWFEELDWSLAAVLPGPHQGDATFRAVNNIFSFANYFVLGLYLAVVFTY